MTTYRRARFRLGTIQQGRTYVFSALEEFRTERAARDYLKVHPMVGPVYVWRERQAWKHGVNYGMTFEGPLPEA